MEFRIQYGSNGKDWIDYKEVDGSPKLFIGMYIFYIIFIEKNIYFYIKYIILIILIILILYNYFQLSRQ